MRQKLLSEAKRRGVQFDLGQLMDMGLVKEKNLRNYLLRLDFDECLLKQWSMRKTTLFCAVKYDISETQVYRIMYK